MGSRAKGQFSNTQIPTDVPGFGGVVQSAGRPPQRHLPPPPKVSTSIDATLGDKKTDEEDEASLREKLNVAKEELEKREAETQQAVAREKGESFPYISLYLNGTRLIQVANEGFANRSTRSG